MKFEKNIEYIYYCLTTLTWTNLLKIILPSQQTIEQSKFDGLLMYLIFTFILSHDDIVLCSSFAVDIDFISFLWHLCRTTSFCR